MPFPQRFNRITRSSRVISMIAEILLPVKEEDIVSLIRLGIEELIGNIFKILQACIK